MDMRTRDDDIVFPLSMNHPGDLAAARDGALTCQHRSWRARAPAGPLGRVLVPRYPPGASGIAKGGPPSAISQPRSQRASPQTLPSCPAGICRMALRSITDRWSNCPLPSTPASTSHHAAEHPLPDLMRKRVEGLRVDKEAHRVPEEAPSQIHSVVGSDLSRPKALDSRIRSESRTFRRSNPSAWPRSRRALRGPAAR